MRTVLGGTARYTDGQGDIQFVRDGNHFNLAFDFEKK